MSVANTAAERHGIQPVATLIVKGVAKAIVRVRETITLNTHVKIPPGMSKIVAVEWDLVGTGDLVPYPLSSPASSLDLEVQTYYHDTGTYLPAIQITSQREGNADSLYARAKYLGRARVVVN